MKKMWCWLIEQIGALNTDSTSIAGPLLITQYNCTLSRLSWITFKNTWRDATGGINPPSAQTKDYINSRENVLDGMDSIFNMFTIWISFWCMSQDIWLENIKTRAMNVSLKSIL